MRIFIPGAPRGAGVACRLLADDAEPTDTPRVTQITQRVKNTWTVVSGQCDFPLPRQNSVKLPKLVNWAAGTGHEPSTFPVAHAARAVATVVVATFTGRS